MEPFFALGCYAKRIHSNIETELSHNPQIKKKQNKNKNIKSNKLKMTDRLKTTHVLIIILTDFWLLHRDVMTFDHAFGNYLLFKNQMYLGQCVIMKL